MRRRYIICPGPVRRGHAAGTVKGREKDRLTAGSPGCSGGDMRMEDRKIKVILDVDTGSDDAIAIAAAVLRKELDVIGICTVGGNVEVKNTTALTIQKQYNAKKKQEEMFIRLLKTASVFLISDRKLKKGRTSLNSFKL